MNIIGSRIIELDETFSTNDFASSLIRTSKQADGTIVLAEYQTNGKGQGNNIWSSVKGENLLFSIIIFPEFLTPDKQFFLSVAVCLSLVDTINEYTKGVCEIKWPNDILLNNKKVSGILIQNTLAKNAIKNSIIGIGLNVNQKDFPKKLFQASSLYVETKLDFDKRLVFNSLVRNLNINYNYLKNLDYTYLKNKFLLHLYKLNIPDYFTFKNGKRIEGITRGIDESGKLIIEINDVQKSFSHGEVTIDF